MILGFNGNIATKPMVNRSIAVDTSGGYGKIVQKNNLIELEVVFGNGKDIDPGDTVFVGGDSISHQWAKIVLDIAGEKVIVFPAATHVMLVKKKEWPTTASFSSKCGSTSPYPDINAV